MTGTIGIYEIGVADGRVQQLVPGGADEAFPDFSLDGKWLYFSSRRSGAERICKIPASGGNPVLSSDYEVRSPFLLPAGNGVVYLGQDGAVRLQPLPDGNPLQIFDEVYSAEHVDTTQEDVLTGSYCEYVFRDMCPSIRRPESRGNAEAGKRSSGRFLGSGTSRSKNLRRTNTNALNPLAVRDRNCFLLVRPIVGRVHYHIVDQRIPLQSLESFASRAVSAVV